MSSPEIIRDLQVATVRASLRSEIEQRQHDGNDRELTELDPDVERHQGEPALVNDAALATASWPWLREAGFEVYTSFRSCGADDFSYYARTAPALMIFLGTGGPFSLHHPEFLPPDDMVGQVASAMLAGYLGALALL